MKKNKKYYKKGLVSKIIPNCIQHFDAYIRLKLNKSLLKENKKYDRKGLASKIIPNCIQHFDAYMEHIISATLADNIDRKGLASKIIPNFIQYFDAYIRLKLNKPLMKENKKNTRKKIQNIYIKNRNL